jgi:hypothetical protein
MESVDLPRRRFGCEYGSRRNGLQLEACSQGVRCSLVEGDRLEGGREVTRSIVGWLVIACLGTVMGLLTLAGNIGCDSPATPTEGLIEVPFAPMNENDPDDLSVWVGPYHFYPVELWWDDHFIGRWWCAENHPSKCVTTEQMEAMADRYATMRRKIEEGGN